MTTPSRRDEIRRATAAAIEHYTARRATAAAAGARPPQPGDIYLFPGPAALDLLWVVVAADEGGFRFAVPADGHSLAGLSDVVVGDASPCGPLTLRCGHGLWIHPEELGPERRVAVLEERYVRRAAAKLAQLAAAKLEGTAAQWEAEANPDYADWLAEVERAADTLADALRIKEEELTGKDFSASVGSAVPEAADAADWQPAMAAAGGGALAKLYEELGAPAAAERPPARRVDFLYPGEIFLLLEQTGVAVLYVRAGGAPPPELHEIDAAGQEQPAQWQPTPRATAMRAAFPWREGQVKLRFGRGASAREVTVRP